MFAPYVPSSIEVVTKMLEVAQVKPEDVLYDLGSGDGRVLILAALQSGCHCIGIEQDTSLISLADFAIHHFNLKNNIDIIEDDYRYVDLSPASVVTVYLTRETTNDLRSKFKRELKCGSRIVSHEYELEGWRHEVILGVPTMPSPNRHRVILYKMS